MPWMHVRRCTRTHARAYNSLWCPEPVWPSTGMWSEAGNVWAMKACVYAGCSRPSPARGKTDTRAAPLALHLTSSPPNPQRDLLSPLGLQDFSSRTSFFIIPLFFLLIVFLHFSSLKSRLQKQICTLHVRYYSSFNNTKLVFNVHGSKRDIINRKSVPEINTSKTALHHSSRSNPCGDPLLAVKMSCLDNDTYK